MRRRRSSGEAKTGKNDCGLEACLHLRWAVRTPSARAAQAREHPIQSRGKGLLRPGIIGRRSAGDRPRHACLVHEVAHRERSPIVSGRVLLAARIQHRHVLGTSSAASGTSWVTTRSPALAWVAMYWSATSAPPSTQTALTSGLPGGVWSRWFATRTVSIASRLAARNTSSFTSLGEASASIQIFRLGSLPRRR